MKNRAHFLGLAMWCHLALGNCQSAAARAFVPDAGLCKPPTRTELAWLVEPDWRPFSDYIRVCRVENGKRNAALYIVSVWAGLYYRDKPSGTVTAAMPKPLLFNTQGKRIGKLPVNFPEDPPVELHVEFTDWRNGFPYQIRLCVISETASGNQALPVMRYIASNQTYVQHTNSNNVLKSGDCHV